MDVTSVIRAHLLLLVRPQTLPLPSRPRRTETTRRLDLDVLRVGGRGARGAPSPYLSIASRKRTFESTWPRRRESEWRAVASRGAAGAHALIASPVRRAAAGP